MNIQIHRHTFNINFSLYTPRDIAIMRTILYIIERMQAADIDGKQWAQFTFRYDDMEFEQADGLRNALCVLYDAGIRFDKRADVVFESGFGSRYCDKQSEVTFRAYWDRYYRS